MQFYSDIFFRLSSYCTNGHVWMTGDSHCFSKEEDDMPQAPYPHVNRSRPKVSNEYWSSYRKPDDSSHNTNLTTLRIHTKSMSRRLFTLHSTASNHQNIQCSQSVPPVTIPPLFLVLHSYLWSSLRSFPIPWPCLLPFHCKSSFHILFYTIYFHLLTVALLIRCLVVISWALVSIIPVV
jgi:hypothetical protein